MAKKQRFMVRQGDVLIVEVDEVPAGAKPSERPSVPGNVTLAFGEQTGHHHSIKDDGNVALLESADAKDIFLSIMGSEDAVLTHQEHAPITLPAGKNFKVSIQREYSPQQLFNVAD